MARRKREPLDNKLQPSLFDLIQEDEHRRTAVSMAPASYNISLRLRNELSEGLRRCDLSRYEVAGK